MSFTIQRLEFGGFTYDFGHRSLSYQGRPVPLAPRATEVFELLLLNRDRMVSKEELKERFWGDSFVEKNSIERQISDIRKALGPKSPGKPYIETRYKQGWRLVADVKEVTPVPAAPEITKPKPRPVLSRAAVLLAIVLSIAGFAALWISKPEPEPRFSLLTSDRRPKIGPILTDGRRIFFRENRGDTERIVAIPITGGEPAPLAGTAPGAILEDISADCQHLLIQSLQGTSDNQLWDFPLNGGEPRPLLKGIGDAAWNGAADALALAHQGQMFLFDLNNRKLRSLVHLHGFITQPAWSPDGKRIRFSFEDPKDYGVSLWEFRTEGNKLNRLASLSDGHEWAMNGVWSRDGRYFFYQAGSHLRQDIWVSGSGKFNLGIRGTIPLTRGPGSWGWPALTWDPSTILAFSEQIRPELDQYDMNQHKWVAAWDGLAAYELNYSADGKRVAYVYQRDHTIWTANPDGTGRVRLTDSAIEAHQPHWAPDGSQIVFMGKRSLGDYRIYLVSAKGGPPRELLATGENQGVPTWSHDGRSLIYGEVLGTKARSEMSLHEFDLSHRSVREIPESKGLWNPRLAPNGRYMSALTTDSRSLRVLDSVTGKWSELASMENIDNAQWSYDSHYIYFNGLVDAKDPLHTFSLFRIGVPGGKLEELVSLRDFVIPHENWYGVAPDGTLLAFQAHAMTDVYSIRFTLP